MRFGLWGRMASCREKSLEHRLPYGRGSESAFDVYSHLPNRDRKGVGAVVFEQPLPIGARKRSLLCIR